MSIVGGTTTQDKQNLENLVGVVERLTYHSEESGYTVAKLKVPKIRDLVAVVGSFANIQAGQTLHLTGFWRNHPQYGEQFQVVKYKETKPATITGIEKYLGSGLIKGVGPVTAKRIVAHFKLETLDIIEQKIDRLIEVPGIGLKRVAQIKKTWEQQKAIKEVMLFLTSHEVSTTYAVKIYKQYGDNSIATVTNNPYQLAEDIFGIGFLTADKIACNIGISPWSKFRYKAGIFHCLSEAAGDGHCFLPKPELVERTFNLLTNNAHQPEMLPIEAVINEVAQKEELIAERVEEQINCYRPSYYHTETAIAKIIKQRSTNSISVDLLRVRSWIDRFTTAKNIELSEQQKQAVEMAARSPLLILTGGPGVGKTFTTRTIVALWKAMGKKIKAAAPTGRAAQRLGEMTGIEALTLHRLLEFDPKNLKFKRDVDNPLPQDAIVCDETSMVDLFMAHSLLKAIRPDAQLLLVGDVDQLPSVGPGQILKDLIDSNIVPVVRLTQIFRQAAQSGIVTVAHKINKGVYPQLEVISDRPQSNCLWHSGGLEAEHGVQVISELVKGFLPQQGYNPAVDMMVLAPMTRGAVGTRNLNQVLQALINPPSNEKKEIKRANTIYRESDRVIQLKNDYQREVFNGDIGVIQKIDPVDQELIIKFDKKEVKYEVADLNEVNLAWSITIHKSQGSEYPVVILPLYMTHYVMLSRNLFYTGLTRAKKLAVIIGSKKAIALAVKQQKQSERYTGLQNKIFNLMPDKLSNKV